jgi:coatomer subunit delta
MVVISVALCSKSGKYLLARQFIEISRIRIEGLLAAFPKLLSSGKEHTFVETDQVRYV